MSIDKSQWIVAGAVLSLLAVFVLGVWMPENRKLKHHEQRIARAQEELGPDYLEPAMMDQRLNEVETLRQELDATTRTVPDRPGLASVLRSLTQAVESQGVTGQVLQVRETRQHPGYAELPLSLEFEDSFAAAYAVLREVESLPRLVRLEALNLRVVERGADSPPVTQASLRLSSFYTLAGEEQ